MTEPFVPGKRVQYSWLTTKVRAWLEKREEDLALRVHGAICKCPWCHRWMQMNTATKVEDGPKGYHDVFKCGHCGGTSLWEWMACLFHLVRPITPPQEEKE